MHSNNYHHNIIAQKHRHSLSRVPESITRFITSYPCSSSFCSSLIMSKNWDTDTGTLATAAWTLYSLAAPLVWVQVLDSRRLWRNCSTHMYRPSSVRCVIATGGQSWYSWPAPYTPSDHSLPARSDQAREHFQLAAQRYREADMIPSSDKQQMGVHEECRASWETAA